MVRRLLPGVYEGWIVVAGGGVMILAIGSIFFWGMGAIFNEMITEFGWTVAATAMAFSLRTEVSGVAAPVIGAIMDRIGVQRVMLVGVVLTALGFGYISIVDTLWEFYAGMVLAAIGTSACGYPACFAAVATWFNRRRSSAMAIITVGGGIGGVSTLVVGQLVEELGWRLALRLLAMFILFAGLAIAANVRSRPANHPEPMDGVASESVTVRAAGDMWGVPIREALLSRPFIMMSLGLIALSFATNAVVVHQIPYFERDLDTSKALAATGVAVFSFVSIAGRLGIGVLADRYSKRSMLALTGVLTVVGGTILAFSSTATMAMVGILVIAPAFGGLIPVRPAILADYFGTRHFGTINGVATLVTTTGGAAGPWVVGWMVDVSGSYMQGWLVCVVMAVVAIPLLLLSSPPTALIARYRPTVSEPSSPPLATH